MAQHEQQPEESATRPLAAAVSAAGNFTQTRMYGRALRPRGPAAAAGGDQQPAQATSKVRTQGSGDPATEDFKAPDASREELRRSIDEPARTSAGQQPAPAAEPGPGDLDGELDEVTVACSTEDVAAAQARMSQDQVEPPMPGPAGPALAPPSL